MVNQCEGHVIAMDIEHQVQENILYHYLHYRLLGNLHYIEVFP